MRPQNQLVIVWKKMQILESQKRAIGKGLVDFFHPKLFGAADTSFVPYKVPSFLSSLNTESPSQVQDFSLHYDCR